MVDRIKELIARILAFYEALQERSPLLRHVLATVERYGDRRGGVYASAIAFSGILSLVPVLMVSFAIAGFVLARHPAVIDHLVAEVVAAAPGGLGETLGGIIESAIDSRGTVGTLGLISAAFTGIGWMGLVRTGLTDMWGGRLKSNPVLGKVLDLVMFVLLGLSFVVTVALTVVAAGPVADALTSWLHLEEFAWLFQWAARLVAVIGTWGLFLVVLARLPRQKLRFRVVLWPALVTALIFTALKELGGLYLRGVMSSPAGVAFGPILGIMVFAFLASQIVLYATAWIASHPNNEPYRVIDELENDDDGEDAEAARRPVVLAPVYEERPTADPRTLLTAVGLGAAVAGVLGWWRRR